MKATYATYFVYYVLISSGFVNAFEPISTTFVVGVGVGLAAVGRTIYNYVYESCDSKWIAFNSTGLEVALDQKLFGQHVASRVIQKAVTGFMNNKNPIKPLVLSLHGWTGTGKNFVSQLIAENIYKEGMASSFVHQFVTTHFLNWSQLENYKSQLQQWIKGNVTNCPRSMFIFDKMDKMHPGLIDCIKPYLGYSEYLDGVSYRQAIFIFLSNAGVQHITQEALDFWKAGRDREEIKLHDLEPALSLTLFNNKKSGLWPSSLMDRNLVDVVVPFLPLEYRHVLLCVKAEMSARGLEPNQDVVDQMAREMVYFPKSEKIFSAKGCKTINRRLDYFT
ncbi:torsin-1A-like isoform X2 [Oncorhynchus keta]|uniref:torsin-1A-like isoform X2 n=1 Tax=Oncorhynchus keta TaxID=8018 RepID=UPI0015FB2B69|nr:torsin-1A-like isoform X2 [Oncorhynchus keta]